VTHPLLGAGAVKLELDNGTGTFPYDITAYLDMKAGYSIKRGRPDQFSTVQASELNCTLKNDDGRFTVGNTTYYSPFIDQRIRLTETIGATTSVRFTGYVSGWPVSWEGGPAKIATARVQAFDRFPMLSRQLLGNVVRQEVLALNPASYYPLDEPATAVGASNLAPVTVSATLTLSGNQGAAPVFGVVTPALESIRSRRSPCSSPVGSSCGHRLR
jgi:hypothetical protein